MRESKKEDSCKMSPEIFSHPLLVRVTPMWERENTRSDLGLSYRVFVDLGVGRRGDSQYRAQS